MLNAIAIVAALAAGLLWLRLLPLHLQDFQQMEYQTVWYLKWLVHHRRVQLVFNSAVLAVLLFGVAFWTELGLITLTIFATVLSAAMTPVRLGSKKAKKPLAYTRRAVRVLVASVACGGLLIAGLTASTFLDWGSGASPVTAAMAATLLTLVVAPLLMLLGNGLMYPLEETSRRRQIKLAKAKSSTMDLARIGITGSYGKTTVKELIAAALATKFSTLRTPMSFNTPMGICRVISEDLRAHHEAFVVEMGAYRRGEIRSLCELVGPLDVGVVTGINEQHLERFGSVEATMRAKYEIVEGLAPGGLALFNGDNRHVREMASWWQGRSIVYGVDSPDCDVSAEDIEFSQGGSTFQLALRDGSRSPLRIQLIGRHNVLNALAAVAVGLDFGLPVSHIASALASVPPVDHRLKPMNLPNGAVLIDDTYSSNPDGAFAALDVLGSWSARRRTIVTPGFIELGRANDAVSRSFGERIAATCDLVILVGRVQTKPVLEGLRRGGLPDANVVVVESMNAAQTELKELGSGDVILMENDLPDAYESSETPFQLVSRWARQKGRRGLFSPGGTG